MTRREWASILQVLEGCWPQRPIRDDAAALWFSDLAEFSADVVKGAALSLYRAGREFMPNGAQIRDEIANQTVDAPPFREAWDMLIRAIQARGCMNPQAVVDHLAGRNPVVAQWAAHANVREIGLSAEGDTTVYAQNRAHYETVVQRAQRALTHGGLPPAAVPELRPGSAAPRPARQAVADLVQSLEPEGAA